MLRYKHANTVSSGRVAEAGGGAVLWNVNINTGASGAVLNIYDGTSTSGILVASIDCSQIATVWYAVYCPNGIFYDLTVAAADVTIGYQ